MKQEQRQKRTLLRDEATAQLEWAEKMLAQLVDSYTEEQDGKFSACHPRNGFASVHQQLVKLRKSVSKAKV